MRVHVLATPFSVGQTRAPMRNKPRSYPNLLPAGEKPRVAYFCMEYGIHEEFPIYAGGLGVLAGDFVKSSADLEVPVAAVGILWRQGYVSQKIGPDGMPIDEYPANNPEFLDDTGVRVRVRILAAEVELMVWRVNRYRIAPLFLLDTVDFKDHWINQRLYDPRPDCRLAQEMVLGVGGARALQKLGIDVDVLHFNEGHAVFAGLELIADRMATGMSFQDAWAWARKRIVFTTHTPVPAGNEIHPLKDLRRIGAALELVDSELEQIGGNPFSMTVAGLRLSHAANAVAQLHAETAKQMWKDVSDAAPILGITNGVHQPTWQDDRIREAAKKGESALLETHAVLKRELVQLIQERNGVKLDPERPIIGFARRAAPYKRANLILRDPEWLSTLVKTHGVQLVFSGKAHPADVNGKKLLQEIFKYSKEWPDAIVFLQNYDMEIGRRMTRGADVWLNNPVRPLEASGTSGMKAAMNGVLNCSILDGWWPEGCEHGVTGWAIGDGSQGLPDQDAHDLGALHAVIEKDVLPAWSDRGRWGRMMAASIRMATEKFSSDRMVRDYYDTLYRKPEQVATLRDAQNMR